MGLLTDKFRSFFYFACYFLSFLSGYEDIDGAVAHSVPITVYSHTQYLSRNDGQSAVATTVLPVLNELIPSHTVRGSKLCLLGSGFVRGSALRVRVGGIDVQPVFHETGFVLKFVFLCLNQYNFVDFFSLFFLSLDNIEIYVALWFALYQIFQQVKVLLLLQFQMMVDLGRKKCD